jgi:hypothetical protein
MGVCQERKVVVYLGSYFKKDAQPALCSDEPDHISICTQSLRACYPLARQAILLLTLLGMMGGLAGCGLNPLPPIKPPVQPISVLFVVAPPPSLAIKASTGVVAAVLNDPSVGGLVTWSVTCGSAGACGTFSVSESLSSSPTTYTAPSAIPSGGTVIVTAISVTDPTKSISAKVTITPPVPIAVTLQGASTAVLQIGATVSMNAKITNDVSANPQVQWTATCASPACGSFNPTTTGSEVQTTYTAPPAIPSGGTVTVTATSVTDPTKSASTNIIITKAAPTRANGTYVFQLIGSNFVSGVFIAQDGNIVGGEQDSYFLDQDGVTYAQVFDPISGGSYATTADGNLQIIVKTNDFNVGASGSETMNGVIVSGSRALVIEFDGLIANGTVDLQTSKTAPSGGYAFTASGMDPFGFSVRIGGILNVDSPGGISGTGSVLDFSNFQVNDGATFAGGQSLVASTVSTPDSFGRVVFQIFPRTTVSFSSLYLAGYIVDANRIRLLETSGDGFQGVVSGTALAQGASTGNFSASSLAGSSYVFGAAGNDAHGALRVAGVFSAKVGGSVTGTLNWNDHTGTGAQSPIAFTGSYAVDSTGRATLSNLSDGATFKYQLQFYLTGNGQALLLSGDTAEMITGQSFQQQAGQFTAASFSGSYGLDAGQVAANNFTGFGRGAALGPVTAVAGNGTGTLTGFVDFGDTAPDFGLSGSFTAGANGVFTGTLTGLDAVSTTTANNFTFYLVDGTRIVAIETDSTQLTLGYLELQQ